LNGTRQHTHWDMQNDRVTLERGRAGGAWALVTARRKQRFKSAAAI